MSEYWNWLHRVVCKWTDRNTAEEIVQETYLSLLRRPCKCESEGHAKNLLKIVARRRLIDKWKMSKLPTIEYNDVAVVDPDSFKNEIPPYIYNAIEQLPKQFQETVKLVLLDGLTHQAAADKMNISIGTVLSRINRSKTRLRKILKNQE